MKKIFTLGVTTLLLMISATKVSAQAFEEGKSYVSASYGYSIYNSVILKGVVDGVNEESAGGIPLGFSSLGPIGFQYEYAVSDNVGVGFSGGYSNTLISYADGIDAAEIRFQKITANARINFHFGDHDVIDPYIGLGVGYKSAIYKLTLNGDNYEGEEEEEVIPAFNLPISNEIKFGTRFIFTPNLGAFAEIGIGHGFFSAGLVGKF